MLLKKLATVAFSLALAGCGTTTVVKTVCPPIVQYDQPFLTKLAGELDALPAGSAVGRAVVDYRQLRDLVRACNGT